MGAVSDGELMVRLHVYFIPKSGCDKSLVSLQPSFNDERLNPLLIKVVNDLQKRTVTGQNDTFAWGALALQ